MRKKGEIVMLKKILVPLDGSELAERALPYATALGEKFEAELILLMVLQPYLLPPATGHYGDVVYIDYPRMEERRKEAEAYLARIRDRLAEQKITARVEVMENIAVADGIVDVAVEEGVDVIVKTTHGRSGFSRWVYGSVATKVLQEAPCPVFLVRVTGG